MIRDGVTTRYSDDYTPCGLIREADGHIERIADNVFGEAHGEMRYLTVRSGAHDKLARSLVVAALRRAAMRLESGEDAGRA